MHSSRAGADLYQTYFKAAYFRDMIARIGQAGSGDQILLSGMRLDPSDPLVAQLITAMCAGSKRGAEITALIDAWTFLIDGLLLGPLWWHRTVPPAGRLRGIWHERATAVEKLTEAGCAVHVLNQPGRRFSNPFAGRSHIKTCIINERVYVGGCNLDDSAAVDLMLAFDGPSAAKWLRTQLLPSARKGSVRQALAGQDQQFAQDASHHLLLDAGVPGQSIIYEQALRTIDAAREWLFITCQYFPVGRTAEHLKRAKARGVQVRVLFNNGRKLMPVERFSSRPALLRERLRMPADFFANELPLSQPFLHAKILASETELLVGSHNYIEAGVRLGTAELTLHAQDAELSRSVARQTIASLGLERAQQFEFLR